RAYDGRSSSSKLTALLLLHFDQMDEGELIPRIYGEKDVRSYVATAAPLVCVAAEQQDIVAKRIFREARSDLFSLVEQGYHDLPENAAKVLVLNGGLFQNTQFKLALKKMLKRSFSHLKIIEPSVSSDAGAYMAALQRKQIRLTNSIVTRIRETENSREGAC